MYCPVRATFLELASALLFFRSLTMQNGFDHLADGFKILDLSLVTVGFSHGRICDCLRSHADWPAVLSVHGAQLLTFSAKTLKPY